MSTPRNALLLIGSAKPRGESSSEALVNQLAERLRAHGMQTEIRHVAMAMRTPAQTHEFLQAVDQADALILAFPLYVDSLPYLATLALERIAAHRQSQAEPAPATFLAIANCGFPEVAHNATAIAICRQFAEQADYAWAGGLALGMGGAIAGRPLSEVGGMAHNVVAALALTAEAIAAGNPVPEEAIALMAKPFIPITGYMLMGDIGWLVEARRNHVLTRLGARPFDKGLR
jgi:hypothetical protein